MRNNRKILGTILIVVGLCCVFVGAGFLIVRVLDDREMEKQLEALRPVESEAWVPGDEGTDHAASGVEGTDGSVPEDGGTDQAASGAEGTDGSVPEDGGADHASSGAEGTDGSVPEDGTMPSSTEDTQAASSEPESTESNSSNGTGAPDGVEIEPPETEPTVVIPPVPGQSGTVVNPYADAFRQNGDMVAWLKIDGTVIDYPVMQTMDDENYYLNRGFDKKSNSNGCLIMDTDSTVTGDVSTNLIIHGHNMKSGAMFGNLEEYEKEKYCQEHKYISLYTKECQRNYEVIAVFRSQVFKKSDNVFKYYQFFQANTQEEFDNWYNNIMALAQYDTGVTAEFGDRFLTLSTCVYHVENGRLVVVAKEIEPGDSYEPIE